MKINEFKNRKILILGFGREGMDTFLFLRKLFPKKIIGIADKNAKVALPSIRARSYIAWHLGEKYLDSLKDYDVIIKSPGVPIHLPEVEKVFNQGIITSQTEIFFDNCPGQIVGITGTKGKSTTTSLIYNILKAGRLKAHLVGNIGKPVLSLLLSATPKDIYVFELSAHQLYKLKKSPHIAVFLNIYPEHLDYYKDLNEYALAKANITFHQKKNDYLIFNKEDKIVSGFAKKSTLRRGSGQEPQKIPIKGEYYDLDRNAAREVGKIFKIPKKKIEKTIKNFIPLEHRLENIGTFGGITFYDDALSTIPETAIFAINALGINVQTIMLGGYDRGINFNQLAKKIIKSEIKNLIFFPTTGEKIWQNIKKMGGEKKFKAFFVDPEKKSKISNGASNMKEAVKLAYQYTERGKICLLSCASTSFSIFKDYKEKGDLFKKFVRLSGK